MFILFFQMADGRQYFQRMNPMEGVVYNFSTDLNFDSTQWTNLDSELTEFEKFDKEVNS